MSNSDTEIINDCRRAWDIADEMDAKIRHFPSGSDVREALREASFVIRSGIDSRYRDGRLEGSLDRLRAPASGDPIYLAGYAHAVLAHAGAYPY